MDRLDDCRAGMTEDYWTARVHTSSSSDKAAADDLCLDLRPTIGPDPEADTANDRMWGANGQDSRLDADAAIADTQ